MTLDQDRSNSGRGSSVGRWCAASAVLLSFAWLYHEILAGLLHDWLTDDNYSHGLLVVPVAALIVWQRRARMAVAAPAPSLWGLGLAAASLAVLVLGTLGAEFFAARISMVGVVAGVIWFVWGRHHLRLLAFPLALVVLTIPLPEILFNQIALPLQSLAARAAEAGLIALQVPVLREGNVIVLATGSLEVAEACSGIRSLMSLVSLAVLYGHFAGPGDRTRGSMRGVLALAAVPIAVVANGLRVAGTGVAAAYYGAQVAEGFFHTFSGWLMFLLAFALLVATERAIRWLWPSRHPATPPATIEEASCSAV